MENSVNKTDYLMVKAAFGEECERIPIFLHRQAGRHLPEYNKVKGNRDFFDVCNDPEIASEITIQPVKRYGVDAAIIFSDILVIPKAIGFKILMKPKIGPLFENPLEIENLNEIDFNINLSNNLKYVYEAIQLTNSKLDFKTPVIGFAGGPWTLMAYMVEGRSRKNLNNAKKWLFKHPNESKTLLKNLAHLIYQHLKNQILYGARIVEIFETLAEPLAKSEILDFLLPFHKQIIRSLRNDMESKIIPKTPIILFPKGANHSLKELSLSGCDVLAIDWNISPRMARDLVGDKITLMGNIDPCVLYGEKSFIEGKTREMVREFGKKRYIANLGHGVLPDLEVEKVKTFVETVQSFKFD